MKELERIIKDCQRGKRHAREILYREFAPKMFGVCLQYSANSAEAEDTLQDGFIKVFNNIVSFKFQGSFEGWIRRIMINTALEKFRKQPKLYVVEDIGETVDESVEDIDSIPLDVLLKMVQELSGRYRMVFNLYVMDGYSHHEISTMMNISVGTSKSNLSRARLILKEKVKQYQKEHEKHNILTVC